ncbi:MAG: hypothetical protein AAB316_18920 [Bacteroidota bacterium]
MRKKRFASSKIPSHTNNKKYEYISYSLLQSESDLAVVDYSHELAKSKSYSPWFQAEVDVKFNSVGNAETCHVENAYLKADFEFQPDMVQVFKLYYDGSKAVEIQAGSSSSAVDVPTPPGVYDDQVPATAPKDSAS